MILVLGWAHTISPSPNRVCEAREQASPGTTLGHFTGPKAFEDSKRAREGAQLLS